MLWQLCIKRDQTEGIVKVAKSIYERRVPVLDNWCQVVLRSFLDVLLCSLDFSAAQIFFVFLEMSLDLAELVEQLVVLQNLEILDMEVCFIVSLKALVWLARVDSLQDAKLPEIL